MLLNATKQINSPQFTESAPVKTFPKTTIFLTESFSPNAIHLNVYVPCKKPSNQ